MVIRTHLYFREEAVLVYGDVLATYGATLNAGGAPGAVHGVPGATYATPDPAKDSWQNSSSK